MVHRLGSLISIWERRRWGFGAWASSTLPVSSAVGGGRAGARRAQKSRQAENKKAPAPCDAEALLRYQALGWGSAAERLHGKALFLAAPAVGGHTRDAEAEQADGGGFRRGVCHVIQVVGKTTRRTDCDGGKRGVRGEARKFSRVESREGVKRARNYVAQIVL